MENCLLFSANLRTNTDTC